MAYSDSERQKKQAFIITSAAKILAKKEYSEISMREIAQTAEMGKATLYNFFQSKEEIFIEMYKKELEMWLAELADIFSQNLSISEAIDQLVRKHCLRTKFIKLMSLLNTVLETNLDSAFLKKFKFYLLDRVLSLANQLSLVSSHLTKEQFGPFIIHYTAHFNGIYLMGRRSKPLKKILMDHPELSMFLPDLETEMKIYLNHYFTSLNIQEK